jgi:hypothetical protein
MRSRRFVSESLSHGALTLGALLVLVVIGCSSKVITKRTRYEVARVDTIHGVSYPYSFTRAIDLRNAGLYEAAAYDYVILFPEYKDSVVHAMLAMDQQLEADHDSNNAVWYLKQSVAGEAMHDPQVWHDGKLDQKAINKRYEYVDELLYSLRQYGLK